MFYRTQLKSVGMGGAVDMQGRRLAFIGYLPCKAGDWVYTDGAVIFGNSKPKGAPAIFDEPSGIPVLGDFNSSGEEELRGYFTTRGKFKKYNIKGDDWIVNGKKNYNHDSGEGNIIDAEITLDDNGKETGIYTVEKIVTKFAEPKQEPLIFRYGNSYAFVHLKRIFYSTMNLDDSQLPDEMRKQEFSSWTNMSNYELPHIDYIRIDDLIIRECELIIKKNDENVEKLTLSEMISPIEDFAFEYANLNIPREQEQHIKTRAILCNFKILPNGKWQALIASEIGAEYAFFGKKNGRKVYTASSTVQVSFLFKITSDGEYEKIAELKCFYPLWFVSEIFTRAIVFGEGEDSPLLPTNDTSTFPYIWYEYMSFEQVIDDTGAHVTKYSYWEATIWDSNNLPNAPVYKKDILSDEKEFIFPVQDDYQAKIISRYTFYKGKYLIGCKFGGIFDQDDNEIISGNFPNVTNAYKWNMSLATLKDDSYLFGIHKNTDSNISGKLYKIDRDGNIEQVGAGLKNFRLRELKKIGKAKK